MILTTDANDWMREVHHRMPVVLRPEECREWLSEEADFEKVFDRSEIQLNKSVA